jgi:C-terminal processing protease CtpA/Prc
MMSAGTRRVAEGLLAMLLLSGASGEAFPSPPPAAADLGMQRLAHLAELWGVVKFIHPFVATMGIDWDGALLAVLPEVQSARSTRDYRAALQRMLGTLGDPAVTHLAPETPPASAAPSAGTDVPLIRTVAGGTVTVVTARRIPGGIVDDAEDDLIAALAPARRVIVDLRRADDKGRWFDAEAVSSALVGREVVGPTRRSLSHVGYPNQAGDTTGRYRASMSAPLAPRFAPGDGSVPKRVAFLLDPDSVLPDVALALRAAGDAVFVAADDITEDAVVDQVAVDLGEGIGAVVRAEEITSGPRVRADMAVAHRSAAGDPAFAAGLVWVKGSGRRRPPLAPAPPAPSFRWDEAYETPSFPDPAHRLLAVFRYWNIIHHFYPYKALMGDAWDRTVLPQFIPRVLAATDAVQYGLVIAEMSTFVPDGHSWVTGGDLGKYFGDAGPPVAVRMIEGQPVVTGLGAAPAGGLAVGDVLVSIDGEPVAARMQRIGRYIAASTPAAHGYYVALKLLLGAEGSTARITVRDAAGKTRQVDVKRDAEPPPHRGGAVVEVLPGNVGYMDLDRLERAQVDGAFDRIKDTIGLVLDLRGYPHGTGWELGPRLNVNGARWAAILDRPLVNAAAVTTGETQQITLRQPMPVSSARKYDRPVVTLIDERTQSQAEHAGLFLEAACSTRFVGSPSAGANGDITSFWVPGGLLVTFTGQGIRHVDGRQLQRVGLVPHVLVAPTIAGLRSGRDEVLERALAEVVAMSREAGRRRRP